MINPKIIQRAIAKSIVNDTGDLIKLVNNYTPVDKNITYADLLLTVQNLLATNIEFANKYAEFLVKKGRIIDYNNAVGLIAGAATLVGSLINSGASKQDAQTKQQLAMSENTQQMMQLMMQEENARLDEQRRKTNLIYISIGAMVVVLGLVILTK